VRLAPLAALLIACRTPAPPPAPADALAPPPAPAPAPTRTATSAPPPPPIETDWCVAGLAALDEETCYVLPPLAEGKPRRLLLYLHGIVPPVPASPQKENVMASVLHAATRAGAAALVPRGVRGIGPAGSKDWWGWPTSPGKHAELAPSLVARIEAAKKKLETLAGAPFERTYLAGSSSGAYFATNLALRGDIDVDALGAMSGGAPSPVVRKRPLVVYVGFGRYDDSARAGAKALARTTEAAGWKTKLAEHPFGHGAREVYLDEAFAFWDAAVVP
jgi:predicted esterase